MQRVIFLDVDGPLIPGRQYGTKDGTHRREAFGDLIGYRFDWHCVKLITELAQVTGAKLVWNTTHNERGLEALMEDAACSHLEPDLFHERPQTTYPGARTFKFSGIIGGISRITAIEQWLSKSPEIGPNDWIAIDDESIPTKRLVHVNFQDGFTGKQYDKALGLFGVEGQRKSVLANI